MKIVKTASGKKTIRMSKKEWQSIGKKAGWVKKADKWEDEADLWNRVSPKQFKSFSQVEDYISKDYGGNIILQQTDKQITDNEWIKLKYIAADANTLKSLPYDITCAAKQSSEDGTYQIWSVQ